MKKTLIFFSLSLILLVFAACSQGASEGNSETNGSSDSESGSSEEAVSLRFATAFNGGDGQIGQTMQEFKKIVESESEGSIEIEIFDSGALGGERDILESVSTGSVDMALSGLSDVVFWLPEYFLSAPYLFRDQEHVRAVYEGELGQEINQKILEQKNIRTLGIMNRGPRHLTTADREVQTPDDIEGLKLRLSENPLWVDTWQALGADTTVVPFPELYTALQTGIVDAQENPLETIVQSQFYEVQNNLILTSHVRDIYKIQISEETWKTLSSEQQEIINNAVTEATALGDEVLEQSTEENLNKLEEEGMNIIEPNLEAFREELEGVGKEIANENMKEGLYETVKNDY